MSAEWTNLILGPELHRGRLSRLTAAGRSPAPSPLDLVLRLADARITPAQRELVARESALAALVRSPFVVAHEPVTEDPARPFSIMQRIEGLPLHELLRATPGADVPRLCLPAVLDTIEGLAAFHAAADAAGPLHPVHQAPVPRHIVVGVDGVARLIDFTQAVSRRHPPSPALRALLHPDELAPEQRSGPDQVDARTDVFIAANTFIAVHSAARAVDAPAVVHTSAELERVLAWARSRDPAARPGRAETLLDALREALARREYSGLLASREELGRHVRRLLDARATQAAAEAPASARPFASTYSVRGASEPAAALSSPSSGSADERPRVGTAPERLESTPPARRDYWFALYRDEHARERERAPSQPPAALGAWPGDPRAGGERAAAHDALTRERAELVQVAYAAPPTSTPPAPTSAPRTWRPPVLAAVAALGLAALGVAALAASGTNRNDAGARPSEAGPLGGATDAHSPASPTSGRSDGPRPASATSAPSTTRPGTGDGRGLSAPAEPVSEARRRAPRTEAPRRSSVVVEPKRPARNKPRPQPSEPPEYRTPTLTLEDFLPSPAAPAGEAAP